MIPQLQVPTDNFYKFLFISFFFVFLCSIFVPEYLETKLQLYLMEIEATRKVAKVKMKLANSQLDSIFVLLEVRRSELSKIKDKQDNLIENLSRITDSISNLEIDVMKKKSLEINNLLQDFVTDYTNNIELDGKLQFQIIELYEKSVEAEMLLNKATLMQSKLDELKSFAPRIRVLSGIFTILFMVLWFKWQRKMDKKNT